MIKNIINSNETVLPNAKQMAALKENFPACFKRDGSFDLERFKEFLSDKTVINNEGYELKFLGKNYARLLASVDTTTVVVPDEEHNQKAENKDSQNIYISGDNLDGLKHLLKSYAHKVKCIYIDPPYNTGSDGFVYNDNFNFTAEELSTKLSIDEEKAQRILDLTKRGSASHSAWLTFMYPRLLLARDLLTDDGVIFISIDDNEQGNLKLLCDDVFGEENFIAQISVIVKTEGRQYGNFAKTHEFLYAYAKNNTIATMNEVKIVDGKFQYYDEKGGFNTIGLRNRAVRIFNSTNRPNLRYPFYVDTANKDKYGFSKVSTLPLDGWKEVWASVVDGLESVWRWGKETAEKNKEELVAYQGNDGEIRVFKKDRDLTTLPKTVWADKAFNSIVGTREVADIVGKGVFDFPKPLHLLKQIIEIVSNNDDIILDFFSGSATTAHAVMKLNTEDNGKRKFIMVQLSEGVKETSEAYKAGYKTIDEIGRERIIRAAKKIKEEHPDTTADLGFKHYTLQEPNAATLDKLEKFVPKNQGMFIDNDILADFGTPTVLTTWLVRDGYGFNAAVKKISFADYTGYYIDKNLYLIEPDISQAAIAAIVEKYETDGKFNPENIVLFGYSFTWTDLDELKINLARLKDTEKNLRINFDLRY